MGEQLGARCDAIRMKVTFNTRLQYVPFACTNLGSTADTGRQLAEKKAEIMHRAIAYHPTHYGHLKLNKRSGPVQRPTKTAPLPDPLNTVKTKHIRYSKRIPSGYRKGAPSSTSNSQNRYGNSATWTPNGDEAHARPRSGLAWLTWRPIGA